ncbi:hypothetical protein AJ80_03386 [Polytolypa hystricis UAMH7299]|uniref:A-pheromone processing metallopeptidase Ste23 n=1 Tax=Polytolypa hystricis (strain UAMH7299) TaxID=1447883 RepID=A0A2B7YJ62_POLH7|nr:hypothetical protein AJ80_03386 [Polytolypa hystricis UAMH7299]
MAHVERMTDSLEKPELDDRSYRVIRLPNKLEALLVHDPNTDKASAAMDVNVGNFSDPEDLFGLAHALEHMLFMGTEKYPKENAYNQYLTAHSGHSNAYTAATDTNYYFEIGVTAGRSTSSSASTTTTSTPAPPTPAEPLVNGHSLSTPNGTNGSAMSSSTDLVPPFYGALDRFAQFFVAPLFLEATLDRELRAVDSENKKNLQSDPWRLLQLNKSLSSKKHPYHHFSTGNLQTLRDEPQKRGIDVRKEFMNFHERQYSANRMKLVVLGREPLDELERWVAELFADVKNKDLPQNRWDDVQPFAPEDMGKQVFAKPVMDTRSLDIYFPYQDEEHMYNTQPSRYISHLIGHEGPGSILAYLKAKGWANGLSAGMMPVCPGSAFFTISVRLTEDGLKEYRQVTKIVFQYISLIKERAPEEWIFEELRDISEVEFRYRQKSPASRFTSALSSTMQRAYPRERLLSAQAVLQKFDPELITRGLSYLRADNFNVEIVSQTYPGTWDSKEKWYGTEYKLEDVPEELLADVRRILDHPSEHRLPELHLPHKNEFVPTRLDVEKKEVAEPTKMPKLIRHDDRVRTWFKKDDTFWVPKAAVEITLRSPLVYSTPVNHVMSRIYCELVRDALNEYSYDAEVAGLDYSLGASVLGLEVAIVGYNDKLAVLLEKVLVYMRDLEVKPDRFKIIKERMTRGFRNAEFQQPYNQVSSFTRYLTAEKAWINEQLAPELEFIEAQDVTNFFPQLLRQTHIEVLVHGNYYKEDALKITNLVESTLKARPLPPSQWRVRRNLIMPAGSNFIYEHQLKDPANVNHSIEYYLFVGNMRDSLLRSKLLLFGQMTHEPAFDQLRTQEQLGYVVWSGPRYGSTTMGYRVIIQSERSPTYLESRIDAFLARFAETLENMTEEEFEGHKRSVVNRSLEKMKNLGSETSRYWSHIGTEFYDFLQHEMDAETVQSVAKDDMVEFYRHHINPQSPNRAKLSVFLNAQASHNVSDTDKKTKLVEGLTKILSDAGIEVPSADKLKSSLEGVDISSQDKDTVLSATRAALESASVALDKLDMSQVEKLLSTTSIVAAAKANGAGSKPVTEPTYITNVPEFKSTLAVSAATCPVADLSEFEDIEPKL